PVAGSTYEFDRVYCQLGHCAFHLELGDESKVRSLLAELNSSETFKTRFFQVEHELIIAKMSGMSAEDNLGPLQAALTTTRELGTLHQQCRVLNQLADILISVGQTREAVQYSKTALELAEEQDYKPLVAKARLLAGIACVDSDNKARNL